MPTKESDAEATSTAAVEEPKPASAAQVAKGCPTCGGELMLHTGDNPYKEGCYHCMGTCGTCWQADLKSVRV